MKQDDFQDGNANGWEAQSGSDYAVITTPYSYVYRQSSIVGNAMSLLANTDWKNQSIQADMTPTAFDGNDRWFGLIGRYVDPNNYYYVTVRNSNSVQLRKMSNGAFTTLDAAALPVSLSQTYNVRFEAMGSLLRVYVDGKMLLETHDSTHSHGLLGVMTYRTRADYDNVIVGSQQLLPLLNDREGCAPNRWQVQGESLWTDECLATGRVQVQSSTAGTARAMSGVSTTHQILETTATATAFNGGDRWLGVMSRFVDPNNYYYLTVRSNNTVSLRRLKDGVITVLDSAPLNVAVGTPYKLRLEAIGSSLRGYVNGTLLVEAKDATFSKGRYGLVTYKTAARFESFEASQP